MSLDLQALGMRLGEAIAPTPSDASQVGYGTVAAVNADGTLDVELHGATLRGLCATTGCVGAQAGMRCVVLRQGPLATVVGLIASTDLWDITLPDGDVNVGGDVNANGAVNATGGMRANWLSVNGGAAAITSGGNATVNGLDVLGAIRFGGTKQYKDVLDSTGKSVATATWTPLGSVTLDAGVWVVVFSAQFASNATGRRSINLSTTSGSTSLNVQAALQLQAANGGYTVVSRANILDVSATTTYYLNGYQNSGSTLTTTSDIRAARIA